MKPDQQAEIERNIRTNSSAKFLVTGAAFGLLYVGIALLVPAMVTYNFVATLTGAVWIGIIAYVFRSQLGHGGLRKIVFASSGGTVLGMITGYLFGNGLDLLTGIVGGVLVGALVGYVLIMLMLFGVGRITFGLIGLTRWQSPGSITTAISLLGIVAGSIYGVSNYATDYPRIFGPVAGPAHLCAFLGAMLGWYLSQRRTSTQADSGSSDGEQPKDGAI